jgi:hypothetical protein
MSNLIALTCPSCGGRLEVTNNTDRYVCAHCGNSHIVDPGVRAESLAKEVDELKSVSSILRLKDEIEVLEHKRSEINQQIDKPRKLQEQNDTLVGVLLIVSICVALGSVVSIVIAVISHESIAFGNLFLLFAALGVVWLTKRGRFTMIYPQASDDVLKELVHIDRQLAMKKRELDQRQHANTVIGV